jgi:hypothetical protein
MSAPRPESQRAAANRELVDDIRRVHHDAAVEPPTAILGILVARVSPVLRGGGRAKRLLKEGDSHPLKAVGAVAGIVVFAIVLGWRAIV